MSFRRRPKPQYYEACKDSRTTLLRCHKYIPFNQNGCLGCLRYVFVIGNGCLRCFKYVSFNQNVYLRFPGYICVIENGCLLILKYISGGRYICRVYLKSLPAAGIFAWQRENRVRQPVYTPGMPEMRYCCQTYAPAPPKIAFETGKGIRACQKINSETLFAIIRAA